MTGGSLKLQIYICNKIEHEKLKYQKNSLHQFLIHHQLVVTSLLVMIEMSRVVLDLRNRRQLESEVDRFQLSRPLNSVTINGPINR